MCPSMLSILFDTQIDNVCFVLTASFNLVTHETYVGNSGWVLRGEDPSYSSNDDIALTSSEMATSK